MSDPGIFFQPSASAANRGRTGRTRYSIALLALLAGCQSAWYSARFVPAPLEVQLQAPDGKPGQARALLTVRGIRRAVAKENQPDQVEILLRIDNLGEPAVALVPEGFDLVSADLVSFGAPRVQPPIGDPVASGAQITYLLVFPVPPDRKTSDLDWRGLNFKWTVSFEGREVATGVTFDRYYAPDYYGYDPYWPYPSTSVGVGISVGG